MARIGVKALGLGDNVGMLETHSDIIPTGKCLASKGLRAMLEKWKGVERDNPTLREREREEDKDKDKDKYKY